MADLARILRSAVEAAMATVPPNAAETWNRPITVALSVKSKPVCNGEDSAAGVGSRPSLNTYPSQYCEREVIVLGKVRACQQQNLELRLRQRMSILADLLGLIM